MRFSATSWFALLAIVFAPASKLRADVELPSVFSDNMVLQQGIALPVWGRADPGEKVTISLADQEATVRADPQGDWRVKLEPMVASGQAIEMIVTGKNIVTFSNVLVGEVWVISGQSNMAYTFRHGSGWRKAQPIADMSNVRCFNGYHPHVAEPQFDNRGQWIVCSEETAPDFSIVAFFFAHELQNERNVPVGIINASWGGLEMRTFMSWESIENDAILEAAVIEPWKGTREKMTERLGGRQAVEEDLRMRVAEWKETGERRGGGRGEKNPLMWRKRPASIYNSRIHPVIPYAIRGALWWQGEWNAHDPLYHRKFSTMIVDWRKRWAQGDFPFLYVQLQREGRYSSPMIREAFLRTLSLPNTAMAVTIDLPPNLHPREKDVVAHRLMLAADAVAYGKSVAYSGPVYRGFEVEGPRIRISYDHVGGGVVAEGGTLSGFAIAGVDKRFHSAQAEVDGDTTVVSSDNVKQPVAVRYGWANVPECNLFNREGLPASPFRTDDWPDEEVQFVPLK